MARAGQEAGRDVRLAQPKAAQLFLKSVQSRAKTDRLDAAGLALYGLCHPLKPYPLKPYPLKSEMHDHLDQLLAARKGLSLSLSLSLSALQARQKELPRAAKTLEPAVVAVREQIEAADKEIARLTRSQEALEQAPQMKAIQELQKVPGIGPIVAATLVCASAPARFLTRISSWPTAGSTSGCDKAGRSMGAWGSPSRARPS